MAEEKPSDEEKEKPSDEEKPSTEEQPAAEEKPSAEEKVEEEASADDKVSPEEKTPTEDKAAVDDKVSSDEMPTEMKPPASEDATKDVEIISDDAESVAGATAGSVTGAPDLTWPSMQDLNTRLRRVITSYQRNYKKEELKQQQKAKVSFIIFCHISQCFVDPGESYIYAIRSN